MTSSNDTETKTQLVETYHSAKTLQETLEAFNKMEESKCFPLSELGLYCFPVATKLHNEGNDSEKVLSLSKMALESLESLESLEIMIGRDNSVTIPCTDQTHSHNTHLSFIIAQVLNLLGIVCIDLKMYIDSLRYFERADKILSELLENEGNYGDCILSKLEVTQLGLFEVKKHMGKREEAVVNFKKFSDIRVKTLEEGCMELGKVYKGLYGAYLDAMDMKAALPFCLKALEIHRKYLGNDSMEVAEIMISLVGIYDALGECEKALELSGLARSVLEKVAPSSPHLMKAELAKGSMLSGQGRYEEAIEVLKGVASHVEADGFDKANAFNCLASVSFSLGKFADAKKYMRTAQNFFEKEEMDPLYVASGFNHMAILYADINDRITAISLLRRVIAIPKIPQKLLLDVSTRLFMSVSQVGKDVEAIPYMEDALEKLKDIVGSKHYTVGLGCNILGPAYKKSGQPELAIKYLTNAKKIMDVSRGPDHLESLHTSYCLALTYAQMRRVGPALAILEKVVEGLNKLGPSGKELLDEAVELLKNLNIIKRVMAGPAGPLINDLFPNLMI